MLPFLFLRPLLRNVWSPYLTTVCCIILLWIYWTTPCRISFLICSRCLSRWIPRASFKKRVLATSIMLLLLVSQKAFLYYSSSFLYLFLSPGHTTVPSSPSWPVSSRLAFFNIKPDITMVLTPRGLFEYTFTVLWYKDTEQSNPWHRLDWTPPLDGNSSFEDTREMGNWGGRCGPMFRVCNRRSEESWHLWKPGYWDLFLLSLGCYVDASYQRTQFYSAETEIETGLHIMYTLHWFQEPEADVSKVEVDIS